MPRAKTTSSEDMTMPNTSPVEPTMPVNASAAGAPARMKMKPKKRGRHAILIVLVIIAILGVAGTAYFYHQYSVLKKNPNAEQQEEVAALVAEVGKLMLLPNETPTVATVEDVSALKGQPFFVNAANGDKVLVFVNARQAVLFRPSEDKIINIAPLYFQNQNGSSSGGTQ